MTTPSSDEDFALQRSVRFGQLPVNTYAAGIGEMTIGVPVNQPFDMEVPDHTAGFGGGFDGDAGC